MDPYLYSKPSFIKQVYSYTENIISISYTRERDGRTYLLLAPRGLLPELETPIYDDLGESMQRYLTFAFMEYVLQKFSSKINSVFDLKKQVNIEAYCRVWSIFYCLVDCKETLQGPWKADDLCLNGIEYRDLAVPLYESQDMKLLKFVDFDKAILLEAEIDKTPVLCVLPDLSRSYPVNLIREINILISIQDECRCVPNLQGVIGFGRNIGKNPCIIGYALEIPGKTLLSEVDVPDALRAAWITRLQKSFSKLHELGIPWGGRGPEDILVSDKQKLYFKRLAFHWNGSQKHEPFDDDEGIKRVMLFLQEKRKSAPMKLAPRQPASTITQGARRLPPELRNRVYEHLLPSPSRLLWAYDHFALESGHKWLNSRLTLFSEEANSFIFENNHFIVEIGRLKEFLAAAKNGPSYLQRITILLHAGQMDGSQQPWKEGIRKLFSNCPRLQKIHVSIYGEGERKTMNIRGKITLT